MTALDTTSDTALDQAVDEALVRGAHRSGRTRAVMVSATLAAVGFVAFFWSVAVGEIPIPLSEVVPSILGGGSQQASFIIHELRLPRALTAVLVGAAFGLSGAIFQSLAHNPLASPDIIGITAGASTCAVFILVVLHGGGAFLSLGAVAGGLVTALAIYFLAFRRGVSAYRLVLVGIGVAAMLNAVTSYLLTRAEIHDAERATVWLTGSLHGRTWDHVEPLALALLLLVPATLVLTRPLRTLQLGDDTARGLGVRVETARAAVLLVGVALAAVATAAAGPVAFVAFVSAPIARRLVDTSLTVVPAALTGVTLLLIADVAARTTFATELPVGVVTGLIGAPYLIWLLARSNRIGRGG